MTYTPVELSDVPRDTTKHGHCKLIKLIEHFLATDAPAAELHWTEYEYKSAASVASSLERTIKRMKAGCHCMRRGNRVYLIRKDYNHVES